MIQGRGGARFKFEPLERLLVVARQILRQKLQRHAPAEVQVFCNPNCAHASRVQAF